MHAPIPDTAHGAEERVALLARSGDPLAMDGPNVIRNLMQSPKSISPMYIYDRRGSQLFERQCETPEYYLRRVETQLLREHAADVIACCGLRPIVELGAGTAEKTQILLQQYRDHGKRCDYFPIDVDLETLLSTAHRLAKLFPQLFVHCVGATYEKGLRALPTFGETKLFLFLGSSLGNMALQEIDALLALLYDQSSAGDCLLLGVDLHKDAAVIHRAYNDASGFGPRSSLNVLRHLNRRYGGNFAMKHFRYRSHYDAHARKNEVHIESLAEQHITLTHLDFTVSLSAGELIEVEVMWKFDAEDLVTRLDRTGFSQVKRWINPEFQYGLFLMRHR